MVEKTVCGIHTPNGNLKVSQIDRHGQITYKFCVVSSDEVRENIPADGIAYMEVGEDTFHRLVSSLVEAND